MANGQEMKPAGLKLVLPDTNFCPNTPPEALLGRTRACIIGVLAV